MVGAAVERWWAALTLDAPVDIAHLVVRCLLVGVWGLVILAALRGGPPPGRSRRE